MSNRFLTMLGVAMVAITATGEAGARDQDLLRAAKNGADASTVQALLKQGADANARALDGATPLLWAAQWDNLPMARSLVAAGAKPDVANDYGVTPLAMAATNGSAPMVTFLLESGADPNQINAAGVTPLMIAVRSGGVDTVKVLLARKANIAAAENVQGQTALMWAIAEQQMVVVRTLIEAGADPRSKSKGGFTPLLFAAREGNIEIARLLLARGVDVNETSMTGLSALHAATARGHVPMALFLLESGANPNAVGPGYSALHWAAWQAETALTVDYSFERGEWSALGGLQDRPSKLALIKALLAKGADVNATTSQALPAYGGVARLMGGGPYAGATPFLLAAQVADTEVMRLLVEHGANPLTPTKDGTTPMMMAAGLATQEDGTGITDAARVDAVKLCLELGGNVNAANKSGRTALHGSARIGLDGVIRFLVSHGAQLQPKDEKGVTPVQLAEADVVTTGMMARYHPLTARMLRELGATE